MSATIRTSIIIAALSPVAAFAQTAAPPATVDFTAVAVGVVGGLITVVGSVALALINSRMKDKQAATVLDNAVTNSLGVVQQAVTNGLTAHPLQVSMPGLSAPMAAGVQYALSHAGDEAQRLGITSDAIADKIKARIRLAQAQAAGNAPVAAVTL